MFDKLTIILMVVLGLTLGGGYLLYQKMEAELRSEVARNTVLDSVIESNDKAFDRLLKNSADQEKQMRDLQNRLIDAEDYTRELRKILRDHDLTMLAEEKPELIEKRINRATKDVFDSIEEFTRSRR